VTVLDQEGLADIASETLIFKENPANRRQTEDSQTQMGCTDEPNTKTPRKLSKKQAALRGGNGVSAAQRAQTFVTCQC
jgi:hypothetical protein